MLHQCRLNCNKSEIKSTKGSYQPFVCENLSVNVECFRIVTQNCLVNIPQSLISLNRELRHLHVVLGMRFFISLL